MKPRHHWSLWILILLLILSIALPSIVMYRHGIAHCVLCILPAVLFTVLIGVQMFYAHKNHIRYVAQLNDTCERSRLEAMQKMPLGLCVLDENGILIHHNAYFLNRIVKGSDCFGRNLFTLLDFDPSLPEQEIIWQERYYLISAIPYHDTDTDTDLTAYIWSDMTDLRTLEQEYAATRPCVLLIMVDSFDDLLQNTKDSTRLETSMAVEKLLEDFISQTNGVLRRMKNDRFLAVIEEQHLQQMINEKFKILDDARQIRVDDKNTVTFSIGVGHGAATLQESEAFAAQSLDMALGRGGDQAAVKTDSGFRFFGGVSKGVEKKSRAKTRVIACALQDMILASSNVYIMGHRFGDLDSIGSACGLAGAVKLMGVPVSVVVDPKKNLAPQLIAQMRETIGDSLFMTPEDAISTITSRSLLIIVDTHNKDILESERLYEAASHVVVIDHHRKNVNYVDNAVVFHHEPYASSACEMVTELIQYFKMNKAIDSCYADCLLSGIMLDTKNFVMRTGVRTFEAAAYLRKIGADTVKVKGLFSGSIEAYRSRTDIVGSAEIVGRHAIAIAPADVPEVRLVAPQAADELLSIQNVDAAFVIYEIGHSISISARSLGAVNVQVIMEALGGGGHQTMAATQIPDISPKEARDRLVGVLSEA
ncbi:MAG: DHH family phosphoesterase [Oscillospiraceae bacterium]|nr:DHH family phosphoesterase [Oscillospiraceae bacterium]